jgi:Flp pilus assembly protein TadG
VTGRLIPARLRGDQRGITLVEFAFVLPPLMMLLLGTLDVGYRSYMSSVVQGVVQDAARRATIGNQTTAQIDTFVRSQLTNFSGNATVDITMKSYSSFTGVKELEPARIADTPPSNAYNAGYVRGTMADGTPDIVNGDCYTDVNENWKRDDMGKTGLGDADEIVYYEVKLTFPRLVPLGGIFGWSNSESVSASTVLRNQPYRGTAAATPPTRCYEK